MESPLDILSRAAGMHQKRQIISDLNEKEYGGTAVNPDCTILKLALVRKNHPGNLESNFQSTSNDTNGDKDSSSQSADEEDIDKPLDMSINKLNSQMKSTLKRKRGDQDDGERSVIVHKRPSVITYADTVQCDIVDEHFKRALGIRSYNEVFKREKKIQPEHCDSKKVAPEITSVKVEVKPMVQAGKPSYREEKPISNVVSQNSNHSSSHELSVDDHFVKALGKSTFNTIYNRQE